MAGDGRPKALELPMFVTASADEPDLLVSEGGPPERGPGGPARWRIRWERSRSLQGRWRAAGETAVILVALDLLTSVNAIWPAQVAALAVLLVLPGFLVLRATGLTPRSMASSPGLLPVTSLVTLTVVGLAADGVGLTLGVSEPLRTVPLLVATNVTCLALSLLPGASTPFRALVALIDGIAPASVALLGIPGLAAVGALRLNSSGGSTVALVATATAVTALALALWFAPSWSRRQLCWVLYASTTALLLGVALRSSYVYGWDISAEYSLVHKTLLEGVWHAAHPGDAYGAMLSLTVLPAVLHAITGMSGLTLLKLVYPALFGLFPVIAFVLARRVLPTRAALLTAVLLLAQGTFIRTMPALGRQELALLAYLSLLAVMLDRRMKRPTQFALLILLSFGVTVFHYSTNYTLISLLALTVAVEFVVSLRSRTPRFDPRKVVALVMAVAFGFIWYAGITRSTSHAVSTASQLLQSGFQILPNADAGQNPIQAFLNGNSAKPVTIPQYQTQIAADYAKQRPWVVKAPDASDPKWQLTAPPASPSTGGSSKIGILANLFVLLVNQLINALAVLGVFVLLLRRRNSATLHDFAVLALPAVMLLGIVRLSGTLAGFYGQDRLLIQMLPIVSVPVFWMLSRWYRGSLHVAARLGKRPRQFFEHIIGPVTIAAISAAVLFQVVTASGLLSAAMGQHTSPNLYNGGEDFERFYVTNPEVAAAEWMARVQPEGTITYTDLYGQLRVFGYGQAKGALLTDITPETVDVNAWVYGTRANIVGGRARAFFGSGNVVYQFPRSFLENQLGIVYSNGTSEVFHR